MDPESKNVNVNRLFNARLEEIPAPEEEQPPQNMLPSNHQSRHFIDKEYENEQSIKNTPVMTMEKIQQSYSRVRLHNWQATKNTVKERLSFLFNNEILSDIHFIVGKVVNHQVIPAHKLVLSAGSAVFDAMFNGVLASQSYEIELPDVEPAAFLNVLKFLYSDEVIIDPESVMTTLYTAKKYAVTALEEHCVDFLKTSLGTDNAFLLLTQARLFDEPQLAALCLEIIDKHTANALSAEGFVDIDQDTLCAVLERDTLSTREDNIFSAILKWSEAECLRRQLTLSSRNQRTVLGRAFNAIRFPLMTVEEFAIGPAQSGLLYDREIVQLFLYFTVNPKPNVGFLDTPRCYVPGKEFMVHRFAQTDTRWGYNGTTDRIRFTVDHQIFVVGFGLYGSHFGPYEYEVDIQILRTSPKNVCGSNTTTFCCDGSDDTFRAMFKKPVEVLPNTSYIASAKLVGKDSHYGLKGIRRVQVDCNNGEKVLFTFADASGSNNGTCVDDGQIPAIIFYI